MTLAFTDLYNKGINVSEITELADSPMRQDVHFTMQPVKRRRGKIPRTTAREVTQALCEFSTSKSGQFEMTRTMIVVPGGKVKGPPWRISGEIIPCDQWNLLANRLGTYHELLDLQGLAVFLAARFKCGIGMKVGDQDCGLEYGISLQLVEPDNQSEIPAAFIYSPGYGELHGSATLCHLIKDSHGGRVEEGIVHQAIWHSDGGWYDADKLLRHLTKLLGYLPYPA